MATIFNLITQLSADPTPMQAGFDRGLQLVDGFVTQAQAALARQPRNAQGQYAAYGVESANAFVSSMSQALEAKKGVLLEAYARGILNPSEFAQLGRQATQAFNRNLLEGLDALDLKKAVPPEARLAIVDALRETGVAAAEAFDPSVHIGSKLRSLGRDFTQVGEELSIALTVPLALGARAALDAADTIEKAFDKIRITTGATGTELSGLNGIFTTLFKSLPVSANDLATALTTISQISGATGQNLADLTTQAVNLARITGTDLKTNVEASQHAFQAWGTSVADQAGNLDILFKVSQRSGTTVADLASTVGRFAPAMREFGLNFTQSAALIGQFQKSGLDADRIFTSLQTSLARFAANGVSGAQAFQLIIDKIKDASTQAAATDLASQVFGPRQAAALASAIRDGKLNIEGLTAAIRASGTTINESAKGFEPYNAAVASLRNQTTLAAATIGTQLEEAFIRIEPALETAAKAVATAADAFAKLPQPVKDAAIGFLTLVAVLGPGVLIFGGVVKAIGALSLAIEILKSGIVRLAFGGVAAETTEFAAAATEASGAVGVMAAGLSALTGTVIVVGVIAAIYAAFEHFTKSATDAKDALADFTANVGILNGKQLNIQTTTLRAQLTSVNDQIKTLSATIDGEVSGHKILGIGVLSGQEDQLAKLQTSAGLLGDQLDAVATAQENLRSKSGATTVELTKFNAAVDALIQGAGKGISIDPTGAVSGSIKALSADLAKLQDEQRIAIRLGKPDTKEFEQAIENVQTGLTKAQTAGLDFPDKLSLGVKNLGKVVEEMVGRTKQLGDGFRQISDIKLDTAIANEIDDLDKKLKSLGDSTTLDAKALRSYYDALRATLAGQLAQPGTAFKVQVDGTLDRITVPTKVGAELFDFLKTGLQVIEDQATKAAAASQRLVQVTAGGFGTAALEDATNVQEREYAKLFDLQNQLQRAFKQTGVSGAAFDAVLKEIGKTITERGANAALVKQFSISQADVTAIAADVQKMLAPLGQELGVKLKIEPFLNLESLSDLGAQIAHAVQKGQVDAFTSGNSGFATEATNAALDQATRAAQAFANSNKGLLTTEQAFAAISEFAKQAGVSVSTLIANMQKLTTLGRAITLAGVFTTIATEIFGANSALTKFGTTVGQTLNGLQALSKANAEIAADRAGGGGASFTSIVDKIGAIGSIVGTAVGLLGSLFGKSQLDIEHDKILASNNAALAALKDSIDREAGTAGRAGDLIKAISAANKDVNSLASGSGVADSTFKDAVGQFLSSNGPLSFPGAVQAGVGAVLKQFGLTIDQADAAAKALGITLQDSKGNFVGLDAFMKALALDAVKLTTLGNDLATNQSLISVRNALNNTAATPAQALKDSVDAIVKTVGPNSGLAQQLQTAFNAGPAALRAALSKIVDEIQAGTLSLQDLGGLTDVNALLSAIGGTAGALNALSTTANAATTALLNVPAGFKKALTEFNAQNAQAGPPGSTPLVQPPFHPDPVPPDQSGILANLATLLAGLTKTPAGKSVSDPITAIPTPTTVPGKSVSLRLTDPQQIPPLAIDASLIRLVVAGSVTYPAPNVRVTPPAPVNIPAPMFHVKQSDPVDVAAPSVRIAALASISLAAPSVAVKGGLPPMTLPAPSLSIGRLAPVQLTAPVVTVATPRPVQVPAPTVTVPNPTPVTLKAPLFSVQAPTQTLSIAAPVVSLSGKLAPVVLTPPTATVAAYTSTVSLSPPAVTVGKLLNVALAAPPVSVAQPKAVSLMAPSLSVQPLSPIVLAKPVVTIGTLDALTIKPPRVTLGPITEPIKLPVQPGTATGLPVAVQPTGLTGGDGATIAKALALLASHAATGAPVATTPSGGDVHLHGATINVDARDKTAAELFTSIKQEAQKIARQQTGNSTNVLSAFQA